MLTDELDSGMETGGRKAGIWGNLDLLSGNVGFVSLCRGLEIEHIRTRQSSFPIALNQPDGRDGDWG